MRLYLLTAAVAATSLSWPAAAQSISVTQVNRANVYGLVQVGPQNGPVTVSQTGQANIAGVVQAGPRNQVSVSQSGFANQASIGQYSTQPFAGLIP